MPSPNGQIVEKWAAIAGRWEFSATKAEYKGGDQPGMRKPWGLARASSRFHNGVIRTQITLHKTAETSARVFFGFQSLNSSFVTAELAGWDKAYTIVEYRPEPKLYDSAGLASNLIPGKAYDFEVSVTGQSVLLTVDDVEVLNTVLTSPVEGLGFGLYAFGESAIEFSEVLVESSQPRVFVIMPFSEPFDTLYREVILPVARNLEFDIVRIDEIARPGIIIEDVQRQIEAADAVVAEISTQNPNVFYELGYAHALRKPAVLLWRRQEGQAMPFDVSGYRAVFYDDSIGGKRTVERNLEQQLKAILGAA